MKYGNYTINEDGNSSISNILSLIKPKSNVIELGSSFGYILNYLKEEKQCTVQGYELDEQAVALANEHGISTKCVDLDAINESFFESIDKDIDYIICADVLEHLKNIDKILKWISNYLKNNSACKLLVSFPNITYYGVIDQLIRGHFKYQELGILDRTHLRFYDKYELEKLFNHNSLEIISMSSISVEPQNSEFNIYLDETIIKLLENNNNKDYLTYQYVFKLQHADVPKKIITTHSLYDSTYAKLQKQKEYYITSLKNIINKKDTQIIELNSIVNKKDNTIIELNQTIWKERNEQLAEIDISIVTYNSEKWLDSYFKSLLKQSFPVSKINIYITDNASTDNTYQILKSLQSTIQENFASFNVNKAKNLGFGAGHNNNLKQSSSKYILVSNVDLEYEADAIEKLVDYAKNDNSSVASWEMRQKPYEHPKYYKPVTLETTWSSSACVLLKKEAITKVGGYDDHIFMYGEDVELSYRLRDQGYLLKYYPKAVCWHYTYKAAGEVKELQYFGSTLANILIRMRYGTKQQLIEGLKNYKNLLNAQGLFYNQRLKQLKHLLKLVLKSPYFLFNRKQNKENNYKFIGWDYEFIRDGVFYTYTENKVQNEPLVSVIVRTCCERNGFLKEAIESIKNQTYHNIELIVIEDGTRSVAEFVESIHNENITNIIYKSIKKAGRCHAGNEGLSVTNGEYLIFLDDDDLFFADHIEVLVQGMLDYPNVAACYSSAFEVKTDIISKNPLEYVELEFNIVHKEEFSREAMLHHNFIPIQCILFKRSLYEEYGGFDEELENLEDWNLWTRYSYLNDFKFIDKTTSLYRVPSCQNISDERKNKLDNYYKVAVKKQNILPQENKKH